jgi:hypothetical protein
MQAAIRQVGVALPQRPDYSLAARASAQASWHLPHQGPFHRMAGWLDDRDTPIETEFDGEPAPGLEGMPRMDFAPIESQVPSLVDQAVRGPVVLTRNGTEAFVLLPLDIYRRLWGAAPRPPVIDAELDPKRRKRRG